MGLDKLDLGTMLDLAVDAATESIRIKTLLISFGIDSNSVTFEAIFNRLEDFVLASINFANVLALLGAIFFVATLLMRTIVPLRVSAIISDLFFVGYAVLANSVTTFILYILLLPINLIRLHKMLKLVKNARTSAPSTHPPATGRWAGA